MIQRTASSRFLAILVAMVICSGCQSANPVAAAQTPEQRAYAAYGTYVIFAEEAATLAENPTIPNHVKAALVRAEEAAKPAADALLAAVRQADTIAAQVAAGTTPQEKYVIALNSLNSWVTTSVPLINALVSAVKGAR